jgi:hypothetical protein
MGREKARLAGDGAFRQTRFLCVLATARTGSSLLDWLLRSIPEMNEAEARASPVSTKWLDWAERAR